MAAVIQVAARTFVRNFPKMKGLARGGQQIRIVSRGETFVFEALQPPRVLLGCIKGTAKMNCKPEEMFSTGAKWEADQ